MTDTTTSPTKNAARDWVPTLAKYREPNSLRSSFELGVSLVPFIALWILACWVANYSYIAAFLISALNGFFLLRLFVIQHDCGHGSFYSNRTVSDWVGRSLGVLTLTPYDVWRRTHLHHHTHSGDLDSRGMGDVTTLTHIVWSSSLPPLPSSTGFVWSWAVLCLYPTKPDPLGSYGPREALLDLSNGYECRYRRYPLSDRLFWRLAGIVPCRVAINADRRINRHVVVLCATPVRRYALGL